MDNHPDIQHNLDERIARANEFKSKYNISGNKGNSAIRILIDPWVIFLKTHIKPVPTNIILYQKWKIKLQIMV